MRILNKHAQSLLLLPLSASLALGTGCGSDDSTESAQSDDAIEASGLADDLSTPFDGKGDNVSEILTYKDYRDTGKQRFLLRGGDDSAAKQLYAGMDRAERDGLTNLEITREGYGQDATLLHSGTIACMHNGETEQYGCVWLAEFAGEESRPNWTKYVEFTDSGEADSATEHILRLMDLGEGYRPETSIALDYTLNQSGFPVANTRWSHYFFCGKELIGDNEAPGCRLFYDPNDLGTIRPANDIYFDSSTRTFYFSHERNRRVLEAILDSGGWDSELTIEDSGFTACAGWSQGAGAYGALEPSCHVTLSPDAFTIQPVEGEVALQIREYFGEGTRPFTGFLLAGLASKADANELRIEGASYTDAEWGGFVPAESFSCLYSMETVTCNFYPEPDAFKDAENFGN